MGVMDIYGDGWKVMYGSCLDRLPELADESVDAVVTDPPYELGFMGKSWDSSGIAYDVNVWRECLRVLKPGGHVLAFGGSRTWHRLAVAVEDAGFELRDSIAWLYGSGFPKSLDVSKAIDKTNGKIRNLSQFTIWFRTTGLTVKQVTDVLRANNLISENGTMASHYFAKSETAQPAIPTVEIWKVLRPLVADVPVWVDELVDRVEAEREVIGQTTKARSTSGGSALPTVGGETVYKTWDETAPATDAAKQWQGWGTALKPAFEPVVVGRKPLKGTVAANVLAYGVGGLNIDGTRIATTDRFGGGSKGTSGFAAGYESDGWTPGNAQGRWPSNVMLDEYTAKLVDQQSGFSKSTGIINRWTDGAKPFGNGAGGVYESVQGVADSGGASRFFYIAKANKRDRNEGLDGLEGKEIGAKGNGLARTCLTCSASVLDGCDCPDRTFVNPTRQNFHPTVKPTDLMRQLIRLVTPLGGVVLDPFTGSGSTGKAAILEGMQFIGCELTEDYLPIIQGRIDWAVEQVKADRVKSEQDEAEKLF